MEVHFLGTRTGFSFAIDVGCWDTVLTVKRNIAAEQGIPVAKQTLTLIHKGKVLLDDQYLEGNYLELVVAADPIEPPEPPRQRIDDLDSDVDYGDDDVFPFGFEIEPPPIRPQPAVGDLPAAPPATEWIWGSVIPPAIGCHQPTTMMEPAAPLSLAGPPRSNPCMGNFLPPANILAGIGSDLIGDGD